MPHYKGPPSFFYRYWESETPRSVVLLLHGFAEHSGLFHRFAAELTRQGNHVWCLDHVGHGLTGERNGLFDSIEQLADNAEILMERIKASQPSLPVFVVGHSLGGLTAAELASKRMTDIAGLVLSGPPVFGKPAEMPEKVIFSRDSTYIDQVTHDPWLITSSQAESNLWRAVDNFLPRLQLLTPGLKLPTLVIFGEHDVFTSPDAAERWTEQLPSGRLWVVSSGYHDILQDSAHRKVASEICGFIDKLRHQ